MNLQSSVSAIREALGILLEPDSVAELRAPNAHGRTVSGYFNVYVTLNPVRPDLLARAANRVSRYIKNATSDTDILLSRWFLIDSDPIRPAGISATDAEHAAALDRARKCRDWLRARGWPDPVFADSGNGGHLLYRIDIPNDVASTELVKQCLQALAVLFSDDQVVVDLSTYNAARIWKVYGTVAAKGDNTPDRPHRLARLLEVPSPVSTGEKQAGGGVGTAPGCADAAIQICMRRPSKTQIRAVLRPCLKVCGYWLGHPNLAGRDRDLGDCERYSEIHPHDAGTVGGGTQERQQLGCWQLGCSHLDGEAGAGRCFGPGDQMTEFSHPNP